MKKTNTTVLLVAISIMLCAALCIGVTYGLFTETILNSNNKVQAGSLDIDLQMLDKSSDQWPSIKGDDSPIFHYDKWEPGSIDVKILKVVNNGNVACNWQATLVSTAQLTNFAKVIDVYVLKSDSELSYPTDGERATYLTSWTNVGTLEEFVQNPADKLGGELAAQTSQIFGIAFHMHNDADDEYQQLNIENFDIKIIAEQVTFENTTVTTDNNDITSATHLFAPVMSITNTTRKEDKKCF